jgi:hypothetical protein
MVLRMRICTEDRLRNNSQNVTKRGENRSGSVAQAEESACLVGFSKPCTTKKKREKTTAF